MSRQFSEERRIKIGLANLGKHLSEETKKKISIANSNPSNEVREKIRLASIGRHHSEKTKEKLRIIRLGSHLSDKTKAKIGKASREKWTPEMREKSKRAQVGKRLSEETKKKISLATKGEKNPRYGSHWSDEQREKMRLINLTRGGPNLGKKFSKKHKEKIGIANLGKQRSEKVKKQNRERGKVRWQNSDFVTRFREICSTKPNKSELKLQSILDKYHPNTYKYVGDYQICIGGRFPDFININGEKEVIELFGKFWHTVDEVKVLIKHYANFGYRCAVIWDEELKNEGMVVSHIGTGREYIPIIKGHKVFEYKERSNKQGSIILDPVTKKFIQERD